MSPTHVSGGKDPLASLRIERGHASRPRSGSKVVLWVVLLVLLTAGAGGGYVAWMYRDQILSVEVRVTAAEVRVPGVSDSVHSALGYVKSRQQAMIGAEMAGRIKSINVEEGQVVEIGFVLAELEHSDMDVAIEAMEAEVERAHAELGEIETTLAQDERDLRRAQGLYDRDVFSKGDLERIESRLKATSSRLVVQQASIKLSDARLREMIERRGKMFVRAPFTGTVLSKEAEVGESIMPGGMGAASGRGSVVTLADLTHLEVDTDVKEDYVSRIAPGQEASVEVDAVKDRRYKGRVLTIIPIGDRARGTIKVKVEIVDADQRLFPDTAATVHFLSEGKSAEGGKVETQVYVASDAIRKDDNGTFVWHVIDGRVKRVSVDTGDSRGDSVLIQRGLKGGEQLVAGPADDLKDDQSVRVAK
jgi:RND family efflux transporter MFP subunit